MSIDYEVIHSRPDPAQRNKVKVQPIPEHLDFTAMLNKLSGDDITKHSELFKMNYEEILINLSYFHYRDKYIEKLNKEIARKNKQ